MSGAPLFFAEWKPSEDKARDNYKWQVGVIALNGDLTTAIILHKKELIKVALSELTWARWE